jgi:hypothetical protein
VRVLLAATDSSVTWFLKGKSGIELWCFPSFP